MIDILKVASQLRKVIASLSIRLQMHAVEIFWIYVLDKAFSYFITIWDCFYMHLYFSFIIFNLLLDFLWDILIDN